MCHSKNILNMQLTFWTCIGIWQRGMSELWEVARIKRGKVKKKNEQRGNNWTLLPRVTRLSTIMWGKVGGEPSQYSNCPFWVWVLQFILPKLRCAHRTASLPCPHSALRKQGLPPKCEWRCTLLFLTYGLAPSFTIHKRCCLKWKLHPHFLSRWQIFFFFGGV